MWESSLNKKLLQGHVSALLKKSGVRGIRINCKMVRNTKVGYCQLRFSKQEIVKLKGKLKLKYYDWESMGRRGSGEIKKWDADGGCSDAIGMANKHKFDIYKSQRKAPELKLPNGLHFTYVLIYHHPSRGDGCIQASYEE